VFVWGRAGGWLAWFLAGCGWWFGFEVFMSANHALLVRLYLWALVGDWEEVGQCLVLSFI
jgi:hypothetical protein